MSRTIAAYKHTVRRNKQYCTVCAADAAWFDGAAKSQ
jgi:hypothetical protein